MCDLALWNGFKLKDARVPATTLRSAGNALGSLAALHVHTVPGS